MKMKLYAKRELTMARQMKGWSVLDFAEKMGVTRETIYNWETGTGGIKETYARRAAMLLGKEIEELFESRPKVVR